MTIGYGDEVTHGFGLHCPCRGSVSSYPAPLPGEFRQAGVGHIEPRPALGRRHQLRAQTVPRRPSADEPRCIAVGHHAVLRPPEALPFRRRAHVVGVDSPERLLDLPAPAQQQVVRRGVRSRQPVPRAFRPAPPHPQSAAPSRHSAMVSSSFDICLPTFRRCFPIHLRHGAESGRTAKGMTGYAVEFHIPTEHFMSSLTKVSSTTRARHRAWGYAGTRVAPGGPQSKRAHTERSASSPWRWCSGRGPRSTRRCPARRR